MTCGVVMLPFTVFGWYASGSKVCLTQLICASAIFFLVSQCHDSPYGDSINKGINKEPSTWGPLILGKLHAIACNFFLLIPLFLFSWASALVLNSKL